MYDICINFCILLSDTLQNIIQQTLPLHTIFNGMITYECELLFRFYNIIVFILYF